MRTLAFLALALATSGCWFLDDDYKQRFSTVPEQLDDGWEIATPESVGIDPAVLASIHDELLRPDRHFGTLGFLVIQDGKLVFETYLRAPADRDSIHHVQSVTKSVTSLVAGAARDRDLLPDLDTTLCTIVGNACDGLDARKRSITLRHLLTMRSGIAFENDVFSMEMWVGKPGDPLRYILEKPLYADPGARFRYRDADPQLVGIALQTLAGRNEQALAEAWLFGPLGIRDFHWGQGPGGVTMGAHGLHLKPRDLAKLGQLVLDGGTWKGERVISADWLAESTDLQTQTDVGSFGYGYFWWTFEGGFSAWGHGGQYVLVLPEKRRVLVQIARPDAGLHGDQLEHFLELTAPLR